MMGRVRAKFHASTSIREFTANFISGAWNRSAENEVMGRAPLCGGATNRKNYQKNPQKLPHILDMMGHVWAKFHASTLIREFTANFISGAWNRSAETEMMGRVPLWGGATNRQNYRKNPQKWAHMVNMSRWACSKLGVIRSIIRKENSS